MVLRAEPLLKAYDRAVQRSKVPVEEKKVGKIGVSKTVSIFLSPQGKQFDQAMAHELAEFDHVVFFCGRYEGMDARVREITNARDVSVGPFVLTGGELPAALMVDAIVRHVPGVLGDFASREDDRTASPDVYTRPETLVWKKKKYTVPVVLLSGDHKKIEEWRKEKRDAKI
jgi:tRNA (guanine37-N1)-methyltransferase